MSYCIGSSYKGTIVFGSEHNMFWFGVYFFYSDDHDANEKLLREFDLNMAYGPCIGISRIDRWNRAKAFGLNPPEEAENLLKSDQTRQDCLWHNLK